MEYTCDHCRLPIWNKYWIQYISDLDYIHLHQYCFRVSGKYDVENVQFVFRRLDAVLKPPKDYSKKQNTNI